ncbi:hypothetical protein ASC95_22565 [Pelomonas sp. Root1217]|uniref:hypothetical protein n=1 Tax=Pelomonas sp. Root1217 TaxID=1736430 RepID=UPI00070B825A|nr:hypothetical protein [Pelomonas sp. Root1217]KQV48691.1 hypothetical protein ASC95_22565 [Pelomonas sp. Root1217]
MPTALEIVDSAVKIGLGALISAVATHFVTTKNHAHEIRKAAREDKRELLRSIAKTLEEATSTMNLATYAYEHEPESRRDAEKKLVDALNGFGSAKSLALLSGSKKLFVAVVDLRSGAEAIAAYYLQHGDHYAVKDANGLISRMNSAWPAVYVELERAYAETHGDG